MNCSFGLVSCGGNVEVCVYRGIGKRKKERRNGIIVDAVRLFNEFLAVMLLHYKIVQKK